MLSRILVIVVALVAVSCATAAIYTWVDEHGVTHYSQSPPPQGAGTVEAHKPISEERSREARQRLERLLKGQQQRDRQRDAEQALHRAKGSGQWYELWGVSLTCRTATRIRRTFNMARPVFRLNRQCQRVYVDDADRQSVLRDIRQLIPEVCSRDYRGELSQEGKSVAARLEAVSDRYLRRRGEPVEYPDFDDSDLASSVDFCRCVPAFLKEMADPRHRTPRKEIEVARQKAARRCPDLH